MASLDAECEPSIAGQAAAAAEAEIGVLEPGAGNKASTGTGDAAEPASRRLSQGATPTSDSMGNISSQINKEAPRCGAGPEAEARPPEAEAAGGPGGRGDETGSRETPCKSGEACPSLEPHHADTGPVARTAAQPLPKGHAAKTFPASPTKAPGANRAKMTLTGVSKSTNTIQSLAMKLLSVPGCRGGKEPPPVPPATPAAPAQDDKPKVHKARKSISRPAQRPPAEMRSLPPEWGGQTTAAAAAAGGPAEVEYVPAHPEENLEGHRARKSIMKGSFSQSLAEKLSSLPIERLSQLTGGGGEVEHVGQPHDEGPEIHRARKSIMKGGFSQALATKLSSQAHSAASHEMESSHPEYPEVHRARKSHLGGSFSQSLARSLVSETIGQGAGGVSTATAERPTAPRGLAEKPKLHRARKSMFKSSPAQIKLVEMKGDLDRSGSVQQSAQLQYDMLPGRGAGEGSTGLVKRRRPESLGPESARANSLLKEEMAKEVPPLGPMRGGHGARASVSSGAAEALSRARGHEMKAVPSGAAAIPVLDLSKEAEGQDKEEGSVDPWAAEVGDDYSFFYDSYSVDDGRADSDKSSKTEGDVGEDRLSEVEDDEEELEGSGNLSDRSSSSSLKRKGKKKWKSESPWVKPSRKRRRKDPVKPGKGGAVTSARGGGVHAQSEYTEVPLSSLDLPNDNSLSPEPTGASNDASSMETDKYEELPLCSCRMEAPKIDRITELSNNTCMATESTDGQLGGCRNSITKCETMRPSSRVPLMVLCEAHRARMVKHHCCPGCGYFCTAGSFLECHPDFRITHRFHKGCVSQLNGMIFCPHCGEDASEAQEITLAKADTSSTAPLPPPPRAQDHLLNGRPDSTHASPSMDFVKTSRGGRKLLLDGYTYIVDKKVNETTYWRCEKREICNARIRTINDTEQRNASDHSHPPDGARNCVLKVLDTMRTRAEHSEEVTSSVINNVTEELPASVAGALPKRETLGRIVRRARMASMNVDLSTTTHGDNFRMYESATVVILSTEKNLEVLSQKQTWFGDGTFDSAPLGKHLYTIHVIVTRGKTLPLVYCVTGNKQEQTYDEICQFLKDKGVPDPTSITIDFEETAINSFIKNFPNTSVYGCFCHFGQCLWRNIQARGLQQWYTQPDNALLMKQLQALAFVPPHHVQEIFHKLVRSLNAQTEEMLRDFLVYFESTWLGSVESGRRRRPLYDCDLWSVHTRVQDGLPRANNALQGWHQAFKKRLRVTHPTVAKLLQTIRSEQASNEMSINQASIGINISTPNRKDAAVNQRITSICNSYNKEQGLAFLTALAYNF